MEDIYFMTKGHNTIQSIIFTHYKIAKFYWFRYDYARYIIAVALEQYLVKCSGKIIIR